MSLLFAKTSRSKGMAKFFDEIKNKIDGIKNRVNDKNDGIEIENPQDKEPILDKYGQSPAQRRRQENFLMEISRGHEIQEEFQNITKNQVKEDLNKRIQQNLSSFLDEEEIMEKIHLQREQQRQEAKAHRETRKRRRVENKDKEKQMEPLVVEDSVIAFYDEEPLDVEEGLGEKAPEQKTPKVSLLEGQLTIRDINEELRKAREEEEKANRPDITELPYRELIKGEGLPTDKLFTVLKKAIKHVFLFIVNVKSRIVSFILKKRPEKESLLENGKAKFLDKIKAVWEKIAEAEKKISTKLVNWINRVDDRNDIMAKKAEKATRRGTIRIHRFREKLDKNKRKLLVVFSGGVTISLIIIGAVNLLTAYEYSYNGKVLGLVKNQEDVLKIIDIVSTQLTKEHGAEVTIDKEEDIAFNRVWNIRSEIDDMEDVLRRLTYMQDMTIRGYGIYAEDELIDIVESEAKARDILQYVIDVYSPESELVKYEDIGFAENIEILPVDTKLGRLSSKEDVIYKILTGAEEQKVHVVKAGETFSGIASRYGISQADLQASNPTVSPERLSIGQEIILTQAVPLLTVQTVEVSTYIEYLPHDTVYEDNANIYTGETSTKRRGEDGERRVTAKIVRNNGTEVAKLELESAITKEPVTAIVYRGTKALPPKKGTGTFIYPVSNYTLSSRFGPRWGRMHYGIDMAAPTGTKIRASDGGTIIFSGYQGSYGYVVKIDHGGGFVTVYAHCSRLYVKVGEQVYQGQHIANVGSTGRSTGPHCHFEIQYLGVQKNPLNYL